MGALEDAIAAGDMEAAAQLSPFFRGAQNNSLSLEDLALSSAGGGVVVRDPAKRRALATIQGQEAAQRGSQLKTLRDLVTFAQGTRGLDPQLQQNILQRAGIDDGRIPPASVQKAMIDRQRALEVAALRNQGRGARPLPSEVVGAIGTPEFGQRLRDAASSGGVDRQGLQTLYDLDRKERELRAKQNKPGKPSAGYEKLRSLAKLGVPLTEDVVMSAFAPGLAGSRRDAIAADREAGKEPRTYSLGQLAGVGEEPGSVSPEAQAAPDDRRRRLRGLLTGGGY